MKKEKILIIGAGVSGLYTAYLLQDSYDVTLLEARSKAGGRVMDLAGHDMGPSWVWAHQKNILRLIDSLGLELMEQYTSGESLYDSPEGVQRFTAPASAPAARISGGVSALVDALTKKVKRRPVVKTEVIAIKEITGGLSIETTAGHFEASKVISTLPPRLAVERILYTPSLPESVKAQFENIPTWMGYAAKCVIEFDEAFWKEEGLSGFAFSHLGPLGEIHDACTKHSAALFGFLHSRARYDNIEDEIRAQLVRIYGSHASKPKNIYLIDWKKERYTSSPMDALPLKAHPNYGFDVTHFGGKLIFSGTESAFKEGGYLEGAVNVAKNVAESLLSS